MSIPLTLSEVPNVLPYIQYVATAGQTSFPYPFPITQDSDLVLVYNGVTEATDSIYTLSGQGNATGGNLTLTTGATAGDILTLYRDIPIERLTQIGQNSGFSSTAFNAEFNNLYLIAQQLEDSITYCLQVPNTNYPAPGTTLTPAAYANKYLAFDAYGNPEPAVLTSSGSLTGSILSALLNAFTSAAITPSKVTTAAEVAAGVIPTNYAYPESDIRRYGALTTSADNHAAINTALTVSSNGGAPAYIPPGTWAITSACVAAPGSSMHGAGKSSIISVANGIDGLQFTTSDSGLVPTSRFFRDFRIVGTLSGATNAAHGIYVSTTEIVDVFFENIAILNFEYGVYLTNLYDSTFSECFIQNCWFGIYFYNQSITVTIRDCIIQLVSSGTLITGSGTSAGISWNGPSTSVENLKIEGGSIYGYGYNIYDAFPAQEVHISAVDISFASVAGVWIGGTINGFWVRDCWIEQGASSGTIFGIFLESITPSTVAKVDIVGNYINCDSPVALSTGIYLGNSNNGVNVLYNQIYGFDIAIGGGNGSSVNSGGFLAGATIKFNTINIVANTTTTGVYSATSGSILLNSSSPDCEIGPNYIVPGTGAAASTTSSSTSITVPNQSTAGNQQYPVGTPVQCTTTAEGFTAGVTYYIASSSGATVTLSATPAGTAITASGTGSIGSLVQVPLPVVYNAGTPPGVSLHARGSCILTLSDPAVSGPLFWVSNGKTVTCNLSSALTGTSATTGMAATGLPQMLAPSTGHSFPAAIENSGAGSWGIGVVAINTAALTFYTSPLAAAFTGSGTKGLLGQDFSWSLA